MTKPTRNTTKSDNRLKATAMTKTKTTMQNRGMISDLPEHVIHNIMFFLPYVDVLRVSEVSRQFRSVFRSFPVVCFDDTWTIDGSNVMRSPAGYKKMVKFVRFIKNSLARRDPSVRLQKFALRMKLYFTDSDIIRRDDVNDKFVTIGRHTGIDEVIGYAIEKNVEDLELDFTTPRHFYCCLPSSFLSRSISIRVVKIVGVSLEESSKILDGHPSIEVVIIKKCFFPLNSIEISGAKLKNLEIQKCFGLQNISIDSPSFEYFSFREGSGSSCNVSMTASSKKSLIYMSLNGIADITDQWIRRLVSESSLLEYLEICGCHTLQDFNLSCSSLKTLVLDNCSGLQKIEVRSSCLESFQFKNTVQGACEINIIACKSLKTMTLERAAITDQWLMANVSQLVFLEDLTLLGCNLLEKFKLSCADLKTLKLIRCEKLDEVEVEARNLSSFVCDYHRFAGTVIIDSSVLEAQLMLPAAVDDQKQWFTDLRNSLSYFDHCRQLKITCNREEMLIMPENLRSLLAPLYDLHNFTVEITNSWHQLDIVSLIDSLLWFAPYPHKITIMGSPSRKKTIEFNYDIQEYQEEEMSCCHRKLVKCWRHTLKRVILENFNKKERLILGNFFTENAIRLEEISQNA